MSDPLMEQIKNAISNVSDRIKGYTEAAEGFVTGVGKETNRLELLIKRLRECLEKLKKLKTDYDLLIQKITSLEARIVSLKTITSEAASSTGTEACNEKLTEILGLITDFGETIKDFNGDVGGLKGQVTALEQLIGGICDEADDLVKQQKNVEKARQKLETNLGGEEGEKRDAPEGETKEAQPVQEEEEDVPEGWERRYDDSTGRYYYACVASGVTQWLKPGNKCEAPVEEPQQQQQQQQQQRQQQPQQQQSGEDFGDIFDCVNHPKSEFGIDLRNHILEKMFEWSRSSTRAAAAEKLARYANKYLYTPGTNCRSVLQALGFANGGVLANRLLSEMNQGMKKRKMLDAQNRAWTSAASHWRGGRRTRKKRGGWQTPEKLSSLSKTKPIRTLGYLKKKTKKKKKKKKKKTRGKNKRKRKRKRTRKR